MLFIDGKVQSGTVAPGTNLTIVPSGETVTINAIYNNDDQRVPYAKPGESIKVSFYIIIIKVLNYIYLVEWNRYNEGEVIHISHESKILFPKRTIF